MAYNDSLTQLPNRISFLNKLKQSALMQEENKNYFLVLYFIDIDNFKLVNDNEGHLEGDLLLQYIATFIQGKAKIPSIIKGEVEFAARLGGDEFVFLHAVKKLSDIEEYANKLIADFRDLINVNPVAKKYNVSFSIGSAIFPTDANNISALLKYADEAMYYSKSTKKGTYTPWSPDLSIKLKVITDEKFKW
jgi:diguanylate cyclase (GGDEF)-like protein